MKRKILKSILCSLLVIALLAAPMSAFAAKKVAYILKVSAAGSKGAFMRSGSSLKGGNGKDSIIGSLKNGTRVLYWGDKSGQMLKVMTSGGKTGYIYKGYLKTYGAMSSKQVYLTKSKSVVYKKAGATMKKKGSIGKGKPVFVYKTIGEYALVKNLAGGSGYVKMNALKKAL